MINKITLNVPFAGDLNRKDEDERFQAELIRKAVEDGVITYLKPVSHLGYNIPVTLIRKSFAKEIKDSFNPFNLNLNFFSKPTIDDIISQLIPGKMAQSLLRAGGAITMPAQVIEWSGIFGSESNLKDGDFEYGILIIIDDDLKDYVDIDPVIGHEYGHAIHQGGLIDKSISIIEDALKRRKSLEGDLKFEISFKEERYADNIAKQVTGKKPHLFNIRKYQIDRLGAKGFLAVAISFSMAVTILIEGRKF